MWKTIREELSGDISIWQLIREVAFDLFWGPIVVALAYAPFLAAAWYSDWLHTLALQADPVELLLCIAALTIVSGGSVAYAFWRGICCFERDLTAHEEACRLERAAKA